MAKATVNLSVRGTTLDQIKTAALDAISTLGGDGWQIVSMDLWEEMDNAVNADGLDPVWRASVSVEGNL